MEKSASFDSSGLYRYSLSRIWDREKPLLGFIMLNPSTADAAEDDPTLRRTMGFARDWGFGGVEQVNLFAFRATDPEELKVCPDPIGPANDDFIFDLAERADKLVAAWGAHGSFLDRDMQVLTYLASYKLYCLEKTKEGHPKHPLYIKKDCEPKLYIEQFAELGGTEQPSQLTIE